MISDIYHFGLEIVPEDYLTLSISLSSGGKLIGDIVIG
jgi:hypothetical protein